MKRKQCIAMFMTFVLLVTCLPIGIHAADEKATRRVYVHASESPTAQANPNSTVYMGDTFNLYLAVDEPNKGAVDDTADMPHIEPQYDLNGYTVRFYYDPAFFAFAGADQNHPIDYEIPGDMTSSDIPPEVDDGSDVDVEVGYTVVRHGAEDDVVVDGKSYHTAYITVLFSGSWLPEKDVDWYNLCALPLRPLKTGSSEVFISVYDDNDPYTLELLAKNAGPDFAPAFDFEALNAGRHQIQIQNKQRPAAPVANPPSGSYTQPQEITLTAEDGCEIYYTTVPNPTDADYQLYDGTPIPVSLSTTLRCYAVRPSDSQTSMTATYTYRFIPTSPVLYQDDGGSTLMPNVYNANSTFRAYVDDGIPPFGIAADSQVYYTFSQTASETDITVGDDPETTWCRVPEALGYIEIDRTRTVRLMTKKGEEWSAASIYYLGISPAPVTADPAPTLPQEPVQVTLTCQTEGAAIYYTLDGSDPRVGGLLYTGDPIAIDTTCTLRAVSSYDGIFGDVTSYHYLFETQDNYGIDAFHPSGSYEESVTVSLTARDENKTIYYTTDGTEPSAENGTRYPEGEILTITEDTVIQAVCVDDAGNSGQIYTFRYQIKPAAPLFVPETTQFTNTGTVTVYMPTIRDGYELHYTLDGSAPTTSSTKAEGGRAVLTIDQYTRIAAVVVANGTRYSDVVTHTYDIVHSRPAKPMVTRVPGVYTVADSSAFTTQFLPTVSSTKIYYTVASQADGSYPPADPTPGAEGTTLYTPGDEIPLRGETMIKAIAENAFGVRSDLGIYHYTITPEAPTAPQSAFVPDGFSTIPVQSMEGATVTYQLGDAVNTVTLDGIAAFYIDVATGNAYADAEKTTLLCENTQAFAADPLTLTLSCVLNGVESLTNQYTYRVNNQVVSPPYADKPSGTYEQIAIDAQDNLLLVTASCLDPDAELEYTLDDTWLPYPDGGILLADDSVLQLRANKDGAVSEVVSYVYTFLPPAPVISAESGTYADTVQVTLSVPENAPKGRTYDIYYRRNGDTQDFHYPGGELTIDKTMSIKAYIVESATGKQSKNTIANYIIDRTSSENGTVYVAAPYDLTYRLDVSQLEDPDFAEGIKLFTDNSTADIHYTYSYLTSSGNRYETDVLVYNNTPILPTSTMRELTITAWLVDETGAEIDQSRQVFSYTLLDLGVPKTTLELQNTNVFSRSTRYTIQSDWPDDPETVIYYTLDGSDPSDPTNEARQQYTGATLTLSNETTVSTVYRNVCGTCDMCKAEDFDNCRSMVYGRVNEKVFSVRSSGGGGGSYYGGSSSGSTDTTEERRYTKDVFGIEHPTHIGYISGYPDGSVQADVSISREEVATILYRIISKTYEDPTTVTGTMFTDVTEDNWSAAAIEYLAGQDVITGYPDGSFQPLGKLTRAEFAALICRFVGLDAPTEESPFWDVNADLWAYADILSLCEAGYVQGYEDKSFRPNQTITRAEVMQVMNVVLGRSPSEEYIKTLDFNPFYDLDPDAWYYTTVLEATVTHDYFLNSQDIEYEWENWK